MHRRRSFTMTDGESEQKLNIDALTKCLLRMAASTLSSESESLVKSKAGWNLGARLQIVRSRQRLQSISLQYRLSADSRRSSIVKCSRKNAIGPQAIMLMTCLPWMLVAPSRVRQIITSSFRERITSNMMFLYSSYIRSPPIASVVGHLNEPRIVWKNSS
ncbi:unnamed protein product [Sphagnum balticum]